MGIMPALMSAEWCKKVQKHIMQLQRYSLPAIHILRETNISAQLSYFDLNTADWLFDTADAILKVDSTQKQYVRKHV